MSVDRTTKIAFLEKLASLCEEYRTTFEYTKDDDGIHISLGGEEIFTDFLDASPQDNIRLHIQRLE